MRKWKYKYWVGYKYGIIVSCSSLQQARKVLPEVRKEWGDNNIGIWREGYRIEGDVKIYQGKEGKFNEEANKWEAVEVMQVLRTIIVKE